MKIIKWIALGLVLIVLALASVAFLLPRHVAVSRTTAINAQPDVVFGLVNSLQETAKWSPWLAIDPDISLTYSGPTSGVGNAQVWSSEHPNVGNGKQVITSSTPNEQVISDLDFGDMGTAVAVFDLEPQGAGTLITWSFSSDMGNNPIGRWMGLMMDDWVGADYEKGLANLKSLAEGS